MAQRGHRLRQGLALGQQQADLAVAAQITGGREHQVAQAREAGESFGASAQGHAQSRHFSQAARDKGGAGIQAQLQAVAQAGGDGQHVLDGAAHLHAHHVVIGVHAQRGAVEGGDQRVAHLGMFAGRDQRRRLATRDFQRKARAAEHAGP